MILSDVDIQKAIESGSFKIEPRPIYPDDYDTTSVNLHLHDEFLSWELDDIKKALGKSFSIHVGSFDYRTFAAIAAKLKKEVDYEGAVILNPGQFILAQTMEIVGNKDPSCCLAARVEGRSSLARIGLMVHMTAPTIHAGFEGRVTLELFNTGPIPLRMCPGDSICQLIIEKVSSPPGGSMDGTQFQGQQSPRGCTPSPT